MSVDCVAVTGRDASLRCGRYGKYSYCRKLSTHSAVPIVRCVNLFHRRWAVPVLAMLYTGRGERFVTLANRLGASKDVVSATLAQMIEDGLVQRNPGYGHPLRPEYLVAPGAGDLGRACVDLVRLVEEMGQGRAAGTKWAFPAVLAVYRGASRYGEIQGLLPGVTPRALSTALKDAVAAGLVTRTVGEGYPPAPRYALAPAGQRLAPALDAFAAAADALPSDLEH